MTINIKKEAINDFISISQSKLIGNRFFGNNFKDDPENKPKNELENKIVVRKAKT